MFQLIVQSSFTQRLDETRVKVRNVGDHITDPDEVEALKGLPHFVQIWADDPAPEPEAEPEPDPKSAAPMAKPAIADMSTQLAASSVKA